MKKKNLKNTVSNIAGIIFVISGAVLSVVTAGVALPAFLVTSATIGASVSGGVLAYLTGKNPDGSVKTEKQVDEILNNK